MTDKTLEQMRSEYGLGELDVHQVGDDPLVQFKTWLDQAIESKALEPTAMNLATATKDGLPMCRVLLLKGLDHGLIFYGNYNSVKGQHLAENPNACINFYWPSLERQVRITGRVEKLPREESVRYFKARPLASQIGSYVSKQSQIVESRAVLDQAVEALKDVTEIDCPEHWGGYRLIPEYFEFWQGRAGRLNDRICYKPTDGGWQKNRLSP